jgi:hypothetical protein
MDQVFAAGLCTLFDNGADGAPSMCQRRIGATASVMATEGRRATTAAESRGAMGAIERGTDEGEG